MGSPGWVRPRTTDAHLGPAKASEARQVLPVQLRPTQANSGQLRPAEARSILVGVGGALGGGAFDALELDESQPELGQSVEQ